jgi:hypothetical protein
MTGMPFRVFDTPETAVRLANVDGQPDAHDEARARQAASDILRRKNVDARKAYKSFLLWKQNKSRAHSDECLNLVYAWIDAENAARWAYNARRNSHNHAYIELRPAARYY